jgi:hypothetical protein
MLLLIAHVLLLIALPFPGTLKGFNKHKTKVQLALV